MKQARDMNRYGTNLTETEAILAAEERDYEHMAAIVEDMLPGERATLANACDMLASVCRKKVS